MWSNEGESTDEKKFSIQHAQRHDRVYYVVWHTALGGLDAQAARDNMLVDDIPEALPALKSIETLDALGAAAFKTETEVFDIRLSALNNREGNRETG